MKHLKIRDKKNPDKRQTFKQTVNRDSLRPKRPSLKAGILAY